jgi:hypothetical protein
MSQFRSPATKASRSFSNSQMGQSMRMAMRQAAGGGLAFTSGTLSGLTNSEHTPTGNPSLAGAAGAAIGRRTRESVVNSPTYNVRRRHQTRTLPISVRQHAQTQVMGTRPPTLNEEHWQDGKESSLV